MPLNFPDTGIDYDTLARLQAPKMMPDAPMGAGGMAGMLYYDDKAKQDETIQKAMQLAQLNAMMKTQSAGEYMQGAPGRQADISLANIKSQASLGMAPDMVETMGNEMQTKKSQSLTAKQQALLDEANPWANTWMQAKDPESKQAVRDMMKAQGVTKIGGKSIDDIPDANMDRLMQMSYARQVNTPANVAKNQLEQTKASGKYSIEEMKQLNANYRAGLKAEAMKRVQEMKGQNQKWEEQYLQKLAAASQGKGEPPTEIEDEMYNTLQRNRNLNAYLRGVQAPPQIDPSKLGEDVPLTKPPAVTAKPMPKVGSQVPPPTPEPKGDSVDFQKNTATINGKELKIKDRNSDGTKFRLEDGTIIDKYGKVLGKG